MARGRTGALGRDGRKARTWSTTSGPQHTACSTQPTSAACSTISVRIRRPKAAAVEIPTHRLRIDDEHPARRPHEDSRRVAGVAHRRGPRAHQQPPRRVDAGPGLSRDLVDRRPGPIPIATTLEYVEQFLPGDSSAPSPIEPGPVGRPESAHGARARPSRSAGGCSEACARREPRRPTRWGPLCTPIFCCPSAPLNISLVPFRPPPAAARRRAVLGPSGTGAVDLHE